jgi:hypothetical protein
MVGVDKDSLLYRSGDVFLPKQVRTFLETYHVGNATSLLYITNWTFVHFLSGVITGWILVNYFPKWDYYWIGFWWHTLWEVWQIMIGMTPVWTARGFLDIWMDTAFFMAGMWGFRNSNF